MTAPSARTDTIELRAPTPDDHRAIAALLAELEHPIDVADIPARLDAVERDGGTALIAVDGDGTPLGLMTMARFSTLHVPGSTAYITALIVTAAAQGKGVGRAFVDAAREWALRNGCVRLTVTSAEHRAGAHAFYPACGMPYTGRRFSVMLDAPR
jgi:GNAT superfamily N-acetyltransferase